MDALDVDWCLTCQKRTSRGKGYCSRRCRSQDVDDFDCCPSTSASSDDEDHLSFHESTPRRHPSYSHHSHSRRSLKRPPAPAPKRHQVYYDDDDDDDKQTRIAQWPGYNTDGIRAWARAIPPGCGSRQPAALSYCSDVPRTRPEFPLSRQRPALPALCMNTTQPARTARSTSPIDARRLVRTGDAHASCSVSSLVSVLTESIATPESADPHARASPARVQRGKPGVLHNLAAKFRSWGGSGAPPAPTTVEIMKTTTTMMISHVAAASSALKMTQKGENSDVFTILSTAHSSDDDDVFTLPLLSAAAISDADIKESLKVPSPGKRGVWIAGRDKGADGSGWSGYGPAYYERNALLTQKAERERLHVGSDHERELAAYRSRGRKTSRA